MEISTPNMSTCGGFSSALSLLEIISAIHKRWKKS
jgi:hypothetical protein